ncbi:MAG: EutN/CcmL family microcompartment protein [Spirochaetes bacterium]|nr:EutN/CcmL family microcompartment protein [Spirochaetota bacterium]
MILGKVIGNIVSTIKIGAYQGYKMMLVQPIKPDGKKKGHPIIAVDAVQAGEGDTVLINDEGGSAKYILGNTEGAIRTVIVGIVDEIT